MTDGRAPWHAHIYCAPDKRASADRLRDRLIALKAPGSVPHILFVGAITAGKAGPHPIPQFEVHFRERALPDLMSILQAAGLRILVHPLTDDDLADHSALGHWIGMPIELDLGALDPPGVNQGIARFGRTDF